MNIYVPGKGNIGAKIAIVGEGPWVEEEAALEPFVGNSGRFLSEILHTAGIDRASCWLTNVSKYAVPPNSKQGRQIPFSVRAHNVGVSLTQQVEDLRVELAQIQPTLVLAFGATALWALTGKCRKTVTGTGPDNDGIELWRGSILLSSWGFKVVGTIHPAAILHNEGDYWQKYVIIHDCKRGKEESVSRVITLPSRHLHVVRNSGEFHDFIHRHKDNTMPAVDIEAHPNGSCIPICIGIAFTPTEGITVPLWNTDGISDIPDSDLVNLWCMLSDFLARIEAVGANFGYDRDKIKRLGFIIKRLASDVMLKAFAINPEFPKNLAFNTSIYTREPYYKNDTMYEGSVSDLLMGCARDSCVTKEVDLKMDPDLDELGLRPYYENFLLKLHDLYAEIECTGLLVDEDIRAQLFKKYITWDEELRYKMFKIAGRDINANSWQQVQKLIYDEWGIPGAGGTGEEVLTQILNGPRCKNELHRQGIETILEKRRVKKTVGTYLMALPDFDGRMRTSYFLCLKTGRSSTNQQEPPIRPWEYYRDEDNKKKKKARGTAFQTMTKHGDIGPDIRKQYIPDPGCIFLQADSSQAEARVIFVLAEDWQALEDIDKHDYHALTASWFFGGTENDYSKKVLGYECPQRFGGKTLRHAGHLGAGKRKAAIEVNTQARKFKINYQISEHQADIALKIFHAKQPKIKQVFQAGVQTALERDKRWLVAPVPYSIEANKGGARRFWGRWGDELFREAFSYLPQRTVSENTKAAALRIKERHNWIKILVEAHDALLTMVPIERKLEAAKILRKEFECPIDFSNCSLPRYYKLIIPCDVEEGMNYYELSKFKFIDFESNLELVG